MNELSMSDLTAVRSRVSWGAIVAGAVVAFAVYFMLGVLGVAVGLSVAQANAANDQTLGTGAVIWSVASMLISLFIGGYVTTQCTAGESRGEAVIYGVLLWGLLFTLLLHTVSGGLGIGMQAMMSRNDVMGMQVDSRINRSTESLQAAGLTQQQIDQLRNAPAAEQARAVAMSPTSRAAAWWMFGGTALSMIASIAGALLGSGPQVSLFGVRRSVTVAAAPQHR